MTDSKSEEEVGGDKAGLPVADEVDLQRARVSMCIYTLVTIHEKFHLRTCTVYVHVRRRWKIFSTNFFTQQNVLVE